MIIIRKLSLILFFTLLIRVANAVTETASAIDNAAVTANAATASIGAYFAGIIGIVISISIGYGLKRIYDARRESY